MEETVRFNTQNLMDTIPFTGLENQTQLRKPIMNSGMEIGGYRLISLMSVTSASELWFGKEIGRAHV